MSNKSHNEGQEAHKTDAERPRAETFTFLFQGRERVKEIQEEQRQFDAGRKHHDEQEEE